MQITISVEKSLECMIEKFATKKLQAEEKKMQEWKKRDMQKVVQKQQIIWQVQKRTIEAQRQGFLIELEWTREVFESKSTSFENKTWLLKAMN